VPPGLTFDEAARCLAELGHPHRLQAFDFLVKAGEGGAAVSEIQTQLGIPKSTLSHHLAKLVDVGLVTQERQGRVLRCRVVETRARDMRGFLERCCEGLP
jgi:ArsR family transcriptional regulator, arsenate/arsenite/antimonite-responsive transcriptional repressor